MNPISRREFVTLAAAGAVTAPGVIHSSIARPASITAQEVVDRIKRNIGVEWKTETVDTFKTGDPATVVKGIVTTAMATMSVLKQAVKSGADLVITGEPTFYSRSDAAAPPTGRRGAPTPPDAVFAAKNEFIRSNRLVIWRFSEHWRQRKPDPFALGLTNALGWAKLRATDDPGRVEIPAASLTSLASDLKKKLNARGGIRVVGDPQLRVQKIGFLPGTTPIQAALQLLPSVDAVIAGEVREWESVEYARDKVTAGEKKSLILLGRVVSEDPGMNICAQWLKTIVPEVTTTWIPIGDPYWRPV
jgi:putative NIF3 family GTP cyclohydrolase 1 type 2